MKPGRIEVYVHSDMTTANKGVGVVRVRTETDFATKDQDFIDFCKKAAQIAFAMGAEDWNDLVCNEFYDFRKAKDDLSEYLGEEVIVDEVWSITL